MTLRESNYYGAEANREFFSVSQFKEFDRCPAMAMAKLRGDWVEEKSRALILGSLVDAALTENHGNYVKFITENQPELMKKNGEYYADVQQALETVERIKNQPLMMKYLGGEHQVIMTGEIEGVPFKIRMDSYKPGEFIADLKYMASLRSPNLFEPMIKYWGYDLQAACYQEIVCQSTGERLPFYFVIATKEKTPHLAVAEINQWNMDEALDMVKAKIKHFAAIKNGEIEPERCEEYGCDYCAATKIITEPIDTDLLGMSTAQIKAMRGDV